MSIFIEFETVSRGKEEDHLSREVEISKTKQTKELECYLRRLKGALQCLLIWECYFISIKGDVLNTV